MTGNGGKRVLLIGAAGDIGIETAAALHEAGYALRCSVRDAREEELLRTRIGDDHDIARIELSNADALAPRIERLLDGWPDLAALVNCAGMAPFGPMAITPLARLRLAMEINVYSSIALFQQCMPRLEKGKGRLVITSSASGFFAVPFLGYYAMTKRALESAVDSMRMEAGPKGVEVISIQPGRVSTQMGRQQLVAIGKEYDALPDDQRADYGFLYRGFSRNSSQSEADGSGISARMVGNRILGAIETPQPQPRYRIGDDADRIWDARQTLDDRAFDALLMAQFGEK